MKKKKKFPSGCFDYMLISRYNVTDCIIYVAQEHFTLITPPSR